MSGDWTYRKVTIKFQLGDKTLFAPKLRLQTREVGLSGNVIPTAQPLPPGQALQAGSQGFLIRSLPVTAHQPRLRRCAGYLCYVPSQYQRYYIDLNQSFDDYKKQFSSKTRSTITRKVKKYAEHCNGELDWRAYTRPDEMAEFFRLARSVSAKTYQEKLLDAGLPDSPEFAANLKNLAATDQLRAYILFDRGEPVSYLCCPCHDEVLIYEYLGYDPNYMKLSVGTVLQWLALESLFAERRFQLFDFTEGESDHKRLFATHSVQCANVFFLRSTLRNQLLLRAHMGVASASARLGKLLDLLGLKVRIKKLIRFGRFETPNAR